MRLFAPCSFVVSIACLAAQGPTGPSLPQLLQLGPMPANATRLDLRSDGSLTRSSGGTVDLDELDRILANATIAAELVLAIDPNTACAVVGAILDLATAKNVTRVHFAATLPDGQSACLVLALPTGADAPSTIDLRLHRERPGVPAQSCVTLLQRLRRGTGATTVPPFVLGIEIGGDEPFETLLQTLDAVVRAGCERVVVRCHRTDAQMAASEATFAALARAAPVRARGALALDFGPSPTIQVPPWELPQPGPAVHATPFGCSERAPGKAATQREESGYGPCRGAGAAQPEGMAEAIARGSNWLRQQQRPDGSFVDDAGAPDVEASSLVALMLLGDGSTLAHGPFQDMLRTGTGWLLGQQRQDGRFVDGGPGATRRHALATHALAEAAGLSPNGALLRGAVQDALDWLFAQRQPDGGWNDGATGAPSDTITTACSLCAIAAAEFFSFEVRAKPAAVVKWFDTVAEPRGAHRLLPSMPKGGPIDATATAAALFSRFFAGQDPKAEPHMKGAADVLLATADAQDPWCAFWTSHALFQSGGRHWTEWQKRVTKAVVQTQLRTGDVRRSWEPRGGCSRLTTSVLNVLTLEAYYRYSRLVR